MSTDNRTFLGFPLTPSEYGHLVEFDFDLAVTFKELYDGSYELRLYIGEKRTLGLRAPSFDEACAEMEGVLRRLRTVLNATFKGQEHPYNKFVAKLEQHGLAWDYKYGTPTDLRRGDLGWMVQTPQGWFAGNGDGWIDSIEPTF